MEKLWDSSSFVLVQEELNNRFSSAFEGVDKLELQTFLGVMRLLKLELEEKRPEIYKTLLALLKDYEPTLALHQRESMKKYICLLLEDLPELADYIISVLPTCQTTPKMHSLSLVSNTLQTANNEHREEQSLEAEASKQMDTQVTGPINISSSSPCVVAKRDIPDAEQIFDSDKKEDCPNSARFETKDYLKEMGRPTSPPNYKNPWGISKNKSRRRNVLDVKKKVAKM